MKKCIAVMAFAVIFLAAVFLFMRNYPSDRWFSGVFIVAGGVSLWCVWGAEAEAEVDGVGVADKVIEPTETVPVETITS
jgi:hypothetical protein